ncbi:MAG TPA: YeeE/YedE thiosulfate transporter family protein [Steroidobacteraceae bacterium]|nr:YeeE/YedE thiosulfate transporter family protein [Steroidobacteraceae bacterium]
MLDVVLLALTFVLGALLSRVSLCAVAGMQQAVATRNFAGLQRLALAACGAGLSLLLLAGCLPERVWLPNDTHVHLGLIAGAVLLGLGAMINGGCYLGSVLYLGTGNLNFLFTLLGLGLGLRGAAAWSPLQFAATPALRMAMGHIWMLGLGLFALIIVVLIRRRQSQGQWLALGAGLLAGLVYARHPAWSYGSALEALARGHTALTHWRNHLSAVTLFAGAIGAAVFAGRFRVQWPTLWRALRCLAGGAIMGCGAALIPGGNDSLLLWAIPGLTVYGVLAFGLMLGVMALGFFIAARWQRPAAGPPAPAQ